MVVMLSGSSSAGKTTLSRALLPLLDPPAVLIAADNAFPEVHPSTGDDAEPPIVVFHCSLGVWVSAGFTVVVDGSLPYADASLRERCLAQLPGDQTFVVGVTCSTDELRRRERSRPDLRLVGWAERQAHDVNVGLPLLVTVDTTTGDTSSQAESIVQALDQTRHRSSSRALLPRPQP